MPPTHTQPNGKMLLKLTCIILIIALFLNGCSIHWWIGDGRGDWTLDLYEGYAISKINSREILLIHKEHLDDTGGAIVIPNFFVTGYQIKEPYIYLEGILTQEVLVSEEELKSVIRNYYLVNTTNDQIIGPLDCFDSLVDYCNSAEIDISEEWVKTD